MIKINLLPAEYRIVEVQQKKISPQFILLSIFFIFLLASLYHFFLYASIRGKAHHLDGKLSELSAPSKQADELNQTINAKLLPEKKFFAQNILASCLISEILNELSNLLPDSVWFSEFRFQRDKESILINLTGFSRITSKQIAVAQIQEYVNSVKSRLEEILKKPRAGYDISPAQEVKVTLTTNLREISSMEAMQFSVSFKSNLIQNQAKG